MMSRLIYLGKIVGDLAADQAARAGQEHITDCSHAGAQAFAGNEAKCNLRRWIGLRVARAPPCLRHGRTWCKPEQADDRPPSATQGPASQCLFRLLFPASTRAASWPNACRAL